MEFRLPDLGEGIQEAQILKVFVRAGETVAADQPLMEVETDKAAVEIPSPRAGKIEKVHVAPGQTIHVGDPLITFAGEEGAAPPPPPPGKRAPAPSLSRRPTAVKASPAVRKLAERLGVDLAQVTPSGKAGRILREDVMAAASKKETAQAAPPPSPPSGTLAQDAYGPVRVEPLTQIRKTIARRMTEAVQKIPHCTNVDDADITQLEQLRADANAGRPKGEHYTLLTFVILAVVRALKKHPVFNAVYDEEKGALVFKEYVHLGIAVDSERGLVVPVLRDADKKTPAEIQCELNRLAEKVRRVSFQVEELRGSTFTISNAGAVGRGSRYSTPIINVPETAVLALGRARREPRCVGDGIAPRWVLPLSLTFDHRAADGGEATRFLGTIIEHLEHPGRLLL